MPRLLSVALTEPQVVARAKTVTRRLGWWKDKNGRRLVQPGDPLTLVRKSMGRKPGEPLVRLAEVEVVSVRREPLTAIGPGEATREGFPHLTEREFVEFFCQHMRCTPDAEVTRIEFVYLSEVAQVTAQLAEGVG